ncbi:hypothetical protein BA950_04330 [Erythrobacter sp. SAORIC-644]|uniref:hypothetical protein n=1 Tax=Erythrobacter sp. SAORIC-644 TaxID=1869314 RepID=UPI000C36F606|nr:hypothetical protein [Erythrobacter sp. SAORIC-644]MAG04793.1 hypothetical protein [Sphingomonadaceae bacterium]PNQ77277.1 hypothetical protein BA950_04330 [Erythrobacter sp. SAORIC-644]HBR83774.1 hypothetical protein [Erythrobacter sp.]
MSDYSVTVKLIRVLTLICFSLGLFVQVAAQAAVPQNAVAEMVDCAEMAQAIPELSMDADDPSSDREGCCPDMTIDCLVAMNCMPPLALTGMGSLGAAPLNFALSYHVATSDGLEKEQPRPESPPPQNQLTI